MSHQTIGIFGYSGSIEIQLQRDTPFSGNRGSSIAVGASPIVTSINFIIIISHETNSCFGYFASIGIQRHRDPRVSGIRGCLIAFDASLILMNGNIILIILHPTNCIFGYSGSIYRNTTTETSAVLGHQGSLFLIRCISYSNKCNYVFHNFTLNQSHFRILWVHRNTTTERSAVFGL